MKTIKILTFHNANNYGAVLQTYALQHYLKSKYDVYVLNYNNLSITDTYNPFKRHNRNIIKYLCSVLKNILLLGRVLENYKNFENFRNKLNLTKEIRNVDDLRINYDDVYISGSDQIWNPKISNGLDDFYFLNFKESNCKRISYAASVGSISNIKDYETDFFKKISKFDYISVREQNLKEYINSNSSLKAEVVLDPTLLLKKSDWEKIINARLVKDKYIFVYRVSNVNKLFFETVNEISKRLGLKIIYFDNNDLKKRYKCKKENWYKAGPNEFLNLLYFSECVITTSFHGVALSTVFNKEMFIVLGEYPDRLTSIINKFKLNNRVINCVNDIDKIINSNIDWILVNTRLEHERRKSINWLEKSINK